MSRRPNGAEWIKYISNEANSPERFVHASTTRIEKKTTKQCVGIVCFVFIITKKAFKQQQHKTGSI